MLGRPVEEKPPSALDRRGRPCTNPCAASPAAAKAPRQLPRRLHDLLLLRAALPGPRHRRSPLQGKTAVHAGTTISEVLIWTSTHCLYYRPMFLSSAADFPVPGRRIKRARPRRRTCSLWTRAARDWRGLGMHDRRRHDRHAAGIQGAKTSLDEMVYYYDGLCDQPLVRKEILEHSYDRFMRSRNAGVTSSPATKRRMLRSPWCSAAWTSTCAITCITPTARAAPTPATALYDQLALRGVRRISNIQIVKPHQERSGRVVGAAGFHGPAAVRPASSRPEAVILAAPITGGFKMSYLQQHLRRRRQRCSAYEAGATFQQHGIPPELDRAPWLFAWEGQTGHAAATAPAS